MVSHRNQGIASRLSHSAVQLIAYAITGGDTIPLVDNVPQPDTHLDAKAIECFVHIKQGASVFELNEELAHNQEDINFYDKICAQIGEQLRDGDESNLGMLQQYQEDRNKARRTLARIDERLRQRVDDRQLAVQEIEDIFRLPQVIAVKTEWSDVIVFTVRITTRYDNALYYMGTWDIFFGDDASLDVVAPRGDGDMEHYRVRRVDSGLIRFVTVSEFHNWDDGSFCFGSNYNRVDGYARRGEFLHGIQAMIAYMSTVQAHKLPEIPSTFRLLLEES